MVIRRGYDEICIAGFIDKEEANNEGYVRRFSSEYGDVYSKDNRFVICL